MIAEIHNKLSVTGSNLTDRLEDQLTGDFFGALRYLPFALGLQKILGSEYVFPERVGKFIKNLSYEKEPDYFFWKRLKDADDSTVEPDLIIEFENTVICIEVKYNSGLSSDDSDADGNEVAETAEEIKKSKNQLAREARAISKAYIGKNLILLLIARAGICERIYGDSFAKICSGIEFARLSWSDIYDNIRKMNFTSRTEELIFLDVCNLLKRKGFDRFERIDLKECGNLIIDPQGFKFNYKPTTFSFENEIQVIGDLYYEFR